MTNILVAIAAGCAAGLMFASIISGALLSLALFYLAPLPLLVAALGWGPGSAVIGAITASVGLWFSFGLAYLITFIVTVALPACWLGYLALLAKPAAGTGGMNGSSPPTAMALDWYPPGRLLMWIAVLACVITFSGVLALGSDYETVSAAIRRGIGRMINARGTTLPPDMDVEKVLDAVALFLPVAATATAMCTLTLNLWLSGKIVLKSGRLRRPWPDLRQVDLPQSLIVVLAVALALSFVGGMVGLISRVASVALLMAYALIGLAVLHAITQSSPARWWWLTSVYMAMLFFIWPMVLVALLGLVDGPIGLRRRFNNRPKPPTLSS